MFKSNPKLLLLALFVSHSNGQEFSSYYSATSFISYLNATWQIPDGFSPLKMFSSLSENGTRNQCEEDLKSFETSLQLLEPWSVRMADSWGGPQPGALSGNLINLGNWDQCMSVGGALRGRHCLLRFILDPKIPQDTSYVPHNVPIVYALCVPESCRDAELQKLISKEIFNVNASSIVVKCSRDYPSWGTWEIAGGIGLTILCLIIVANTIFDAFWAEDYKGHNGLFTSFSIRRNWVMLSTLKPTTFSCLDGIKTFLQFGVILYHVWRHILKNSVPVVNKFGLNEMVRSYASFFIVQMPIIVDTFFVISGFLVMHSLLSKKVQKASIWRTQCNRLLRVYPVFFVVLLLETTLTGMICDGPLCTDIVRKKQDQCRQYWWSNVLLIHNIYPGFHKSCLPPSWYIAVDVQLFVIFVPLITYGIEKNIRATLWTIGGLAGSSVIAMFIQVALMNLEPDTLVVENPEEQILFMTAMNTQVHSRLSSWGIGLLFGAFMRRQETNKISLSKELAIIMWSILGLAALAIPLLSVPMQKESYEYNNVISAFYNALSRPIWCLGNCWIIFSCCSGYSDTLNVFLSSAPLRLMGKLSYSAYMVHQLVINLLFSGLRAPIYATPLQQATLIFGIIAISYLVAFVLYLTVESPFINVQSFTQNIGRPKAERAATIAVNGHEANAMELNNCTALGNSGRSQHD